MESDCGVGRSCGQLQGDEAKALGSYTVLEVPTGQLCPGLLVVVSAEVWPLYLACPLGWIAAQWSAPANSAPAWLSLLEQSLERTPILHPAPKKAAHPSTSMAS